MKPWQVLEADCLDAMREMDEASVDAIVTDPPYGLEFMGKEWDRLAGDWRTDLGRGEHAAASGRPSGKRGFDGHPPTPRFHAGKKSQEWHQAWATEALRVLKPGGHLLAFGGTRTYHRLACAVEDAGFEIRDSVIWLYGSGFPKSLAVDKAIDRADDTRRPEREALGRWLREQREAKGLQQKEVAAHWPSVTGGLTGCVANWEGGFNCPTLEQWVDLKRIIGLPDDMDAEVWRLNGRKGQPGENWEKREKVGEADLPVGHAFAGPTYGGDSSSQLVDLTAPATPEAQRWQGWGTALKPSHEIVVHGVKPDPSGEWRIIDGNLCALQAKLLSLLPAKPADESSESRPVEPDDPGLLASAGWTAVERSSSRDALCEAMGTSQFESALGLSLSIVSSWRSTLAALYEQTSTSTTETESSTTTDLRTLKSCLSDLTPPDMLGAAMTPDGSGWSALPAAVAFSAVASRLNGTLTLSALARATSQDRPSSPDADASHEPIVVARKPLVGTVAQNVSEFGTGALNIDGCRIGTEEITSTKGLGENWRLNDDGWKGVGEKPEPSTHTGRWPANVALSHLPECEPVGTRRVKGHAGYPNGPQGNQFSVGDSPDGSRTEPWQGHADPDGLETVTAWECAEGCSVAELDRQSGERMHGAGHARGGGLGDTGNNESIFAGDHEGNGARYGDTGGASRFFATFQGEERIWHPEDGWPLPEVEPAPSEPDSRFRYVAKASRAERNAGLEGRNIHPTCKPISLMRWLVRLVCPPGGLVLDPFLGSGTTGAACVLEGFDFIGIEREAEYVEISRARIAWWEQHRDRADEVLALSAKSERGRQEHEDAGQMGLFGGSPKPEVSTGRSIYGDYGEAVVRCPEHGESIPSGSTSYRCGCPIQRGEPARRAEQRDAA